MPAAQAPGAVGALCRAGADVGCVDQKGLAPLHYATTEDCIRTLVAEGADPNVPDVRHGFTPLHLADRVELVYALRECGADPTLLDLEGNNCLMHRIKEGAKEEGLRTTGKVGCFRRAKCCNCGSSSGSGSGSG